MTELTDNPFERHGFHPGLMDLTVQALKRGRNGEGYPVEVDLEDRGTAVVLDSFDRHVISRLVDNATGIESARTVGHEVVGLLRGKIE